MVVKKMPKESRYKKIVVVNLLTINGHLVANLDYRPVSVEIPQAEFLQSFPCLSFYWKFSPETDEDV